MNGTTVFPVGKVEVLSDRDLAALCVWREARGEGESSKTGVAWVIFNRAHNPGWWGHDIRSVVLKPWQFSSFNNGDPNSTKWPFSTDTSWRDSRRVVDLVFDGQVADPTDGATAYFDDSLSANPPAWAGDGEFKFTVKLGRLNFYKRRYIPDQREVLQA